MNPKVYSYTGGKKADTAFLPPDPVTPDLYCRQAEGVYTFQPVTAQGRAYLESLDGMYQGDEIRVRQSTAFPMFDEIFDLGLRVV